MKHCPNCGKDKPLTDFYQNKSKRDGHCCYCKVCMDKKVTAWQRRNPEKFREQQKRNRSRRTKQLHDYYHTHREEFKTWKRAWRAKHLAKIRAYQRKYYRANRAHILELRAKYRQKRRDERKPK